MTLGSGFTGVLPGLTTKARAATTLKGLVYLDLNQNGAQDVTTDPSTNERGFANVTVTAYAKNGAVAGTTTTLADGTWQIVTDAAGPYRVEFTNYASTAVASGPRNGGTSVQFQSGANPVNFTLFGKVNGLGELNDLAFETLEIGNRVWADLNGNGIQDAEEPGIPGVSVSLVDEAGEAATNVNTGAALPTQITNSAGEYYFTGLGGPRGYRVVIDPSQPALAGLGLTTQFATANGGNTLNDSNGFYVVAGSSETALASKPIGVGNIVGVANTAGPGQNDHSFDFGFVTSVTQPKLSLGDYVFVDVNRNGIQDAGDTPVAGAKVELLDGNGVAVAGQAPITTLADGKYLFTGLSAGSYKVRVTRPAGSGVVPAQANAGANDDVDSDIVAETAESAITGVIALTASTTNVDAGWVTPQEPAKASIGDTVWLDGSSRDNVQGAGDAPVQGATVRLLNAAGAQVGASVVTGADGKYLFENLEPGDYKVEVTRPAGSTVSPVTPGVGADRAVDSDGNATSVPGTVVSGNYTLAAGQNERGVDFGWFSTVVSGNLTLGDYVFVDVNRNGIQDAGDTPVAGAKVELLDGNGVAVAGQAPITTLADGKYLFTGLSAGSYKVRVTRPAGSGVVPAQANAGANDDVDSDIVAETAESAITGVIALTASTTNVDAGWVTPLDTAKASIGDRVFFDTNRNGLQDTGELGLGGVTVTLERCDGTTIFAQQTLDTGFYEFTGLDAGQYRIRFTQPGGYEFTTKNVGTNPALDSDADVATGVSGCVTLAAGETNTTVDAGLVAKASTTTTTTPGATTTTTPGATTTTTPGATTTTTTPAVTTTTTPTATTTTTPGVIILVPTSTTVAPTTTAAPTTTVAVSTGCIGDKVFEGKAGDKDGKGIPGITLVLITPEGTSLSTTTDANGLYRFCTLKPGTYTVRVTVPPADATNIYTLDGKNNNATSVTLNAGKDNLDADFGYDLKNVQILPATVEQGPDFPETPVITPSVTGSNGVREALAALAMILTGVGLVGILRSRKERWQ